VRGGTHSARRRRRAAAAGVGAGPLPRRRWPLAAVGRARPIWQIQPAACARLPARRLPARLWAKGEARGWSSARFSVPPRKNPQGHDPRGEGNNTRGRGATAQPRAPAWRPQPGPPQHLAPVLAAPVAGRMARRPGLQPRAVGGHARSHHCAPCAAGQPQRACMRPTVQSWVSPAAAEKPKGPEKDRQPNRTDAAAKKGCMQPGPDRAHPAFVGCSAVGVAPSDSRSLTLLLSLSVCPRTVPATPLPFHSTAHAALCLGLWAPWGASSAAALLP
jgi:hypothetical protein